MTAAISVADDIESRVHDSNTSSEDASYNTDIWIQTQQTISSYLLPLITNPEELFSLFHALANGDSPIEDESKLKLLVTCQQLFRYIEYLADLQDRLKRTQNGDETANTNSIQQEESQPCSLSGLPELYTGIEPAHQKLQAGSTLDAETIWGQVELQNNVLLPRLKKLIKKLTKYATENDNFTEEAKHQIRLLDMNAMDSDDEQVDAETSSDETEVENMEEMSHYSNDQDCDIESSDEGGRKPDDDDRRIRKRMEKAMADIDGSDNDSDIISNDEHSPKQNDLKSIALKELHSQKSILDPAREQMRDGFFDLHEMEEFADDEEEYLPDDAFGNDVSDEDEAESRKHSRKNKASNQMLPHIKERTGRFESDSEEDKESDDYSLTKRFQPSSVRRRKYRADDEVKALYQIYDNEKVDDFDDSDDEEDDLIAENMTAEDLFGKPDSESIHRYKANFSVKKGKYSNNNAIGTRCTSIFDENDSWDNHDFSKDAVDWKKGVPGDESDESPQNHVKESEDVCDKGNSGKDLPPEKISRFAMQSKKLEEQTQLIEQEMMAEKPWKMMGESKGTDRPTDSLLESTPEFEMAFKPPPITTIEHTANIEEMIKKRIIEEDWDDVVPRELPDIGLHKSGGGEAPEVSQEKSKLGLGELYEREYLKRKVGFDRDAQEKETEDNAAKEEMKKLFADLCSQLDALSNYHFTPRPVADEADVKRQDVPAIAMEEVLPLHVSMSRSMAPEEVFAGAKGRQSVLKGQSELDQAERNRIRNAKKSARRKARQQKSADERLISKLQPGLGLNNPYEKRKLREELQMARASGKVVVASQSKGWQDENAAEKEYQTSTKFFKKMQENVKSMIHDDGEDVAGIAKKKRKGMEAGISSSVYKL